MKQFTLRDKTGIKAHGAVFPSGLVALEWTSAIKTLAFYDNVEQVKEFVCADHKDLTFIVEFRLLKEYILQRNEDFSGVSGTGEVAIGIVLPSGKGIHEWTRYIKSINIYPNIESVEHIHGHEGRTKVVMQGDTNVQIP